MNMKKTLMAVLLSTMAIGAVAPAFADNIVERDSIHIGYSDKFYDPIKVRSVRKISNIEINGVTYDLTKVKQQSTVRLSKNAFNADIDGTLREIIAQGISFAAHTGEDITRVKIKEAAPNAGSSNIVKGTWKEVIELTTKNHNKQIIINHDGESLERSIGFDTGRHHLFSDYLANAINKVAAELEV